MLHLGDRQTEPFPTTAPGVIADYTDVDRRPKPSPSSRRIARQGGSTCSCRARRYPWLASHPRLERHLDERYDVVARERGVGTIYALRRRQRRIPRDHGWVDGERIGKRVAERSANGRGRG